MLNIESVNHIGIRVSEKTRSVRFYELLGFQFTTDAGFEKGHPIVMKNPNGVVLNLLGPATIADGKNILMDIEEKHTGITHMALTVSSLEDAKAFMAEQEIDITGSFSFGAMSSIFIRDPDRNVIELDCFDRGSDTDNGNYSDHL